MSGLLLTFLAVILSSLGARDQVTVAALAERQGQRPGLLIVAVVCSVATAALAAWAGAQVLHLPDMIEKARLIFAAIALAFAGAEQLLIGGPRKPEEPTLSLGAAGIVVLAHQVTDAARFLVFAMAVATAAPLSAGIGGAAGGAIALGAAWMAPEYFVDARLRIVRRVIGAVLLLVAVVMAVQTLG